MALPLQTAYAPEFRVRIDGEPIPVGLRGAISSVSLQTGFDGADRVELTLVNQGLQWLDHPLLAMDKWLSLELGYATEPLTELFAGEIVGLNPSFPGSGGPTLTVVAHDLRHRLQQGTQARWFAIPRRCQGNYPLNDLAVISEVAVENMLVPIPDPISATIAVLVGKAETAVSRGNPDLEQQLIRKQVGDTDASFLQRIARENGWEMLIDHGGQLGGHKLRFLSPAERRQPDVILRYGRSLIEFNPRLSQVGQVAAISVPVWVSDLQMNFLITISWDWDRRALDLSIIPEFVNPTGNKRRSGDILLVDEPVTQDSAPRVILSKLLDRLHRRLTGSGSTWGDPRILAGQVLQLEGLGEQFGGLWRVTSASHTIDSGGYRTSFDVRKEVWFDAISPLGQGAVGVQLQEKNFRIEL